jgi:cystathionine gamma-synthase
VTNETGNHDPRFATLAVHAGAERDATGALAPALYLSTNYEHGLAGERRSDYLYIRIDSPTQRRLERALATCEGGQAAYVFSSGVAAGAAYLQSLPVGGHVLFPDDLFYGFRALARDFLARWELMWSEVDMTDLAATRAALRPETRLIWAETPSNPLMKIVDVAALAEVAHDAHVPLLVDATFSTPALQRPLTLGADVVLHSTTKYLGGHGDVQGGALVFARMDDSVSRVGQIRQLLGSVASPFGSWLVLRGLRTLAPRMHAHSANARVIAQALEAIRGSPRCSTPVSRRIRVTPSRRSRWPTPGECCPSGSTEAGVTPSRSRRGCESSSTRGAWAEPKA